MKTMLQTEVCPVLAARAVKMLHALVNRRFTEVTDQQQSGGHTRTRAYLLDVRRT